MGHLCFTMGQITTLAIIPHVTGAFSILGSCSILYDIWCDRKRKLRRTYYRILLGMSAFDVLSSTWIGMSTWPIPRDTAGTYAAVGTTATCTAQGFFVQLTIGSPFYNLMLAWYYLLLGHWNITEEDIARRYEPFMHLFAIGTASGISIAGLPLTLYNSANLWCWISPYPPGCETATGDPGIVECERGQNAWLYRWAFFYGPLWLVIIIITGMMIMLTRSVWRIEKRIIEMQQQNRLRKTSQEGGDQRQERDSHRSDSDRCERSRQIFYQALFYVAAFYITYLFGTINRLVQLVLGDHCNFPLMFLHSLLAPAQGFLNFLAYRHGPCIA